MTTITEDYVSFETAKLLKEKGFNEGCSLAYNQLSKGVMPVSWPTTNSDIEDEKASLIALPTLQMAMKWLRKNHNILITIIPQEIKVGIDALCYGIYRITEDLYQPLYNGKVDNLVDSYEEAVEAAIKYSLENLI